MQLPYSFFFLFFSFWSLLPVTGARLGRPLSLSFLFFFSFLFLFLFIFLSLYFFLRSRARLSQLATHCGISISACCVYSCSFFLRCVFRGGTDEPLPSSFLLLLPMRRLVCSPPLFLLVICLFCCCLFVFFSVSCFIFSSDIPLLLTTGWIVAIS